MRILVTRPQADALPLAQKLRDRGHAVDIHPVLAIDYHDLSNHEWDGVGALVFTSANGVRAVSEFERLKTLPAYAVGEMTAAVAKRFGWRDIKIAGGNVTLLADLIASTFFIAPPQGRLLHVRGAHAAGDLIAALHAHKIAADFITAYEARTITAFAKDIADKLRHGNIDAVLLYSARSAKIFCRLAKDYPHKPVAFCLSEAIAEIARAAGFICKISAHHSEAGILHMLS